VLGVRRVWKETANTKQKFEEREGESVQQMKSKIHMMFDGRGKTYREKV
jgi:hypothetical protein